MAQQKKIEQHEDVKGAFLERDVQIRGTKFSIKQKTNQHESFHNYWKVETNTSRRHPKENII